MKILHFGKKQIRVAESLDELSWRQIALISDILYRGGDRLTMEVHALRILSKIGRIRFGLMNPDFIELSLNYVAWIFESFSFTKQKLIKFRGRYGPASDFDNLKMVEFHFTELYYKEVVVDKKLSKIDNLVAILYRRAKKNYNKNRNQDGDWREKFNPNEIEYNVLKVKKWPNEVKSMILLWYDSCRLELIKNNRSVFEGDSRHETQFETGIYGLMRALAGDKLGPITQIEDMYVHTALLEIGLLQEEAKRIENEFERSRT